MSLKTKKQLLEEVNRLKAQITVLEKAEAERKQVEEDLRESEARYRAVVETHTEFIVRARPDLIRTFVNDAYCRYFGVSRSEAIGTSFLPLVDEKYRQSIVDKYAQLTPQNPSETEIHQAIRSDGSLAWQEWTDTGVFDAAGKLTEVQAVGRDITRRKIAEEERKKSEERFRNLVEHLPIGIAITTPEGAGTEANPAIIAMLGYDTKEEFMSINAFKHYVIPADRDRFFQAVSEGTVRGFEVELKRKDGTPLWISIDSISQSVEGGSQHILTALRDITERKRAEEELQESEQRFRQLSDAAFEGLAISEKGTIINVNNSLAKMLKYESAEMIGMSAIDFVAPTSLELVREKMKSGAEAPYEHLALGKDGSTFPVEVQGKMMPSQGRRHRVTAIRDITERKRAERALRESEEKFSKLFQNSPNTLIISTLNEGRMVEVNDAGVKSIGLARDDLLGKTAIELGLINAETRTQLLNAIQDQGYYEAVEIPVILPHGERRVGLFYGQLITLSNEEYLFQTIVDITERQQARRKLEQYAERLRILREIDKVLLSAMSSKDLLEIVLEQVKLLVHAERIGIIILDEDDMVGAVVISEFETKYPTGFRASLAETDLLLKTLTKGEVIEIKDLAAMNHLPPILQELFHEGYRSLVSAPLIVEGNLIGVLNFSRLVPESFIEEEIAIIREVANPLAITLRQVRLLEQAQQHAEELEQRVAERTTQLKAAHAAERESTRELAILEERNRLARDLHDAVSQTLWSATLIADVLPDLWEQDVEKGRERLARLHVLTKGALAEMRALLLELRPEALMNTSLDELLRQLTEATANRSRADVSMEIEGGCLLPPEVHVTLYRIAQEALNNVARHAMADHIDLQIKCQPNHAKLVISDDGRGFDPDTLPPGQHLGLSIMRERAEDIGGAIDISSQPQEGTQITVIWPARKE